MEKSFKSGGNDSVHHRHTNNDDLARVIDSNSQMGEYRESGLANFHFSNH